MIDLFYVEGNWFSRRKEAGLGSLYTLIYSVMLHASPHTRRCEDVSKHFALARVRANKRVHRNASQARSRVPGGRFIEIH